MAKRYDEKARSFVALSFDSRLFGWDTWGWVCLSQGAWNKMPWIYTALRCHVFPFILGPKDPEPKDATESSSFQSILIRPCRLCLVHVNHCLIRKAKAHHKQIHFSQKACCNHWRSLKSMMIGRHVPPMPPTQKQLRRYQSWTSWCIPFKWQQRHLQVHQQQLQVHPKPCVAASLFDARQKSR